MKRLAALALVLVTTACGTHRKDGKDGADGESGTGERGPAGEKGEPGAPGQSAVLDSKACSHELQFRGYKHKHLMTLKLVRLVDESTLATLTYVYKGDGKPVFPTQHGLFAPGQPVRFAKGNWIVWTTDKGPLAQYQPTKKVHALTCK